MKMDWTHMLVLALALGIGIVLGAKYPGWASTITLGTVKAG